MDKSDARAGALTRDLREAMGDPGLTVRPWRAGTDFWADLVETPDGLAVVRSPRIERAETSYDGVVDFGAVIEKEAIALRLMAAERIPEPQVLGTGGGEPSWILLSYVAHDEGADIPLASLGELTRRLHGIRPPSSLRAPWSWPGFVGKRLAQRLRAARRYCTLPDEAATGCSPTSSAPAMALVASVRTSRFCSTSTNSTWRCC
jgi:hypothetical protein